jgi:hypothetical protein
LTTPFQKGLNNHSVAVYITAVAVIINMAFIILASLMLNEQFVEFSREFTRLVKAKGINELEATALSMESIRAAMKPTLTSHEYTYLLQNLHVKANTSAVFNLIINTPRFNLGP